MNRNGKKAKWKNNNVLLHKILRILGFSSFHLWVTGNCKKTNILTHTYSKSDLPINQSVKTSACLYSSYLRLQCQLYWKISFPLEFSNIAYNLKSNTEFMKTAIVYLAKWNSVWAISSENFTRPFFLEINHWNLSFPGTSSLNIPERVYGVRAVKWTLTSKVS